MRPIANVLRLRLGEPRRFKDTLIASLIRYDRLTGAAFEDSPLVKTDNYFSAGVTLTWFFAKSKTLVDRPSHEVTRDPGLQPGINPGVQGLGIQRAAFGRKAPVHGIGSNKGEDS